MVYEIQSRNFPFELVLEAVQSAVELYEVPVVELNLMTSPAVTLIVLRAPCVPKNV